MSAGGIAKRLVGALAVLVAISVFVFAVFTVIPNSDPAERIAGRSADPALVAEIREQWGFDEPLPQRYMKTMSQLLGGELVSYQTGQDVEKRIVAGLPATISLALGAAAIWITGALVLGYFAARRARADRVARAVSTLGASVPPFVVGAVLLYLLASELDVLPSGGYVALTSDPLGWAEHLLLPWLTLALALLGFYARMLRARLLDAVGAEFVQTARASGVREGRIWSRHIMRPALVPLIASFGLDFAALLAGGAIAVEYVFGLNGVGQYAADSVTELDLPPIMAITLLGAAIVVVLSALADLLGRWADPRTGGRRDLVTGKR